MCRPVRRAGRTGRPLQTGQGREGCDVVADAAGRVAIECGIARVHVEKTEDGMNRVRVEALERAPALDDGEWTTAYPLDLIVEILEEKGPAWLLDEIRRDEATDYVQPELELGLLAYSPPEDFDDVRVLDFGCGMGSSTLILGRVLPNSTIVGVDMSERFVEVARMRTEFFADRARRTGVAHADMRFAVSPNSERLPDGLGLFDAIVLAGVFEHLLPATGEGGEGERALVMGALWSHLKTDGVLYVNQTPWRGFPWEFHTTGLPFVNYLPGAVIPSLTRFSRKVAADASWPELLRLGVRGASVREIVRLLRDADPEHEPVVLKPNRLQVTNRVDLWYKVCTSRPQRRWQKRLWRRAARMFAGATGIEALPLLTLAVAKRRREGQSGSNKPL